MYRVKYVYFSKYKCLLRRIIVAAGSDGMQKVVDKFLELYPDVPKRAVENKVFEISTKEKRSSDATKVRALGFL